MRRSHNSLFSRCVLDVALCAALVLASIVTGIGSMPSYAAEPDKNDLPGEYVKIDGMTSTDILGVDVTRYQQQKEDWEKTWKDYDGNEVDLFEFLKSQGVNTVSIKIAVDPSEDDAYLSQANALATAESAKDAGLKVNLVLLYSDSMTWGNTQTVPAGWEGEDYGGLLTKATAYTKGILDAFNPDIVTIGNEVNYNFLSVTDGNGWNILRLLSQTVKDWASNEGTEIKVAYNFAAPAKASDIQWMLSSDNLNNTENAANYDYVGVNLYSNTHDTAYIEALKEQYHKTQTAAGKAAKLVISINYPYIDDSDPSVDLCSQMDGIYGMLQAMTGEGGFVYNEGDYVGNYSSFFGSDGCAIPSLGLIGLALNGTTDAYIDPYRYGGDFGLRETVADIEPIEGLSGSTIMGVDISSYQALKNAGVKFYDNEGNEASLLKVLKDNGVNYVRLRVWNDPYNENGETYGGGSNDPDTTLEIAKEAAKYGIKVELCIHYSDFWADPSQQILPKAWTADAGDVEKMKQNIYDFTKEVMTKYLDAGVDIGMVQVGNEITNGAFGIKRNTETETYAGFWADADKGGVVKQYLASGLKAVRDVSPNTLTALHIDAKANSVKKTVFDSWVSYGLDFDVLGISYYPFWGSGKVSTPETLTEIAKYVENKGKLFCVFETAWPTTLKDADGKTGTIGENTDVSAYPVGVQGQVDELSAMYKTLAATGNGLGAFYWEPAWIPVKPGWAYWKYNLDMANLYGTGWAAAGADGYFNEAKLHWNGQDSWGASTWENLALFDNNGYPLDSLRFYKDSVPETEQDETYQIIMIECIDSAGKVIGGTSAKLRAGTKGTVTLPKITGYEPASGSYTMEVEAKGSSPSMTIQATYKEASEAVAEDSSQKTAAIKRGDVVSLKGAKYKVTKAATEKARGKVTLIKARNVKKTTVPAKVKLSDNKYYNVTVIGANSFKGKKIRHAVIGANVRTIKKNAFQNSKVTTVTIKSKKLSAKRVKGCLKKSKVKTVRVKLGKKSLNKKYLRKYKKYFKRANSGKKVTVK